MYTCDKYKYSYCLICGCFLPVSYTHLEIMEEVPAQISPKMPIFPNIKGEISFEHVHFSYAGSSRESLNQIDFHIMPGETLGIIGPTGSGKTTLVNLVPRFYDATKGKVLIDGHNINTIDEQTLRTDVYKRQGLFDHST